MITDKDREEAKNIYGSIKIPIEVSVGGLKIASVVQTGTILEKINGDDLADHIARIRAEAAEEALKPALDLLHAMGVSEERIGKDVCRGIDVLSTRYRKELAAVAHNSAEEARKKAADVAVEWVNKNLCDEHMPIMFKRMEEDELRAAILKEATE